MTIYSVFIINRAGGLIYEHDHAIPKIEVEKTFSYPLEPVLKIYDEKVMVAFGQRDNIKVGHTVLAVNGIPAVGRQLEDNRDILEIIADESNYPLDVKFGRQKLSTNEKIMWASTFHSLYAISSQLSPVPKSAGIQVLEVDTFKLHCTQTLTGIKFVMITDPRQGNQDTFLGRMHEIYADYALKNPFYSIDMPIRCRRFDDNLKQAIEFAERIAYTN